MNMHSMPQEEPRSVLLDAIETLLKEPIAAECRAYLRRLYLEITDRKEAT